jgi:diaminopimelate decarboxylase
MDVVSGGEYLRAKAAGVPGERIVFSGVGKTAAEMRMALEGGIRQFNVESEPELEVLSQVASSMGKTAPITVRVNPDVDARTHEKIATGKSENKFGIPIAQAREVYARAAALPGIEVIGIDVHIGSQLTDLEPFEIAYTKVADLTRHCARTATTSAGSTSAAGSAFPTSGQTPPRPCRWNTAM